MNSGKPTALAIALAAFTMLLVGAIPASGSLSLGDETIIREDSSGISIELPDGLKVPDIGTPPPPGGQSEPAPECSDGIDNDGDGKVDHWSVTPPGFTPDPDCASPWDSESGSGSPGRPGGSSGPGGSTEPGGEDGEEGDRTRGTPRERAAQRARDRRRAERRSQRRRDEHRPEARLRRDDGSPTNQNPGVSIVDVGPAPLGVPNILIDRFRIPPFLLPIYQAAGIQYGIRWEILAAVNEIETDYGRNLNVSTAGAVGWMQFLPSTWKAYGVDANNDGVRDPYNPVDAIFGAARYLRAAGGHKDIRQALFTYNRAHWYVDSVLMRARVIAGLPPDFVGSLTGLTQGRFPVAARARYANDIDEREAARRAKRSGGSGNVAELVSEERGRRSIDIFSRNRAPVVAVNDGRVKAIGENERLGKYVLLQDVYGNEYLYSGLGSVAKQYPVPKERRLTAEDFKLIRPSDEDEAPSRPASAKAERDEIGGQSRSAGDTRRQAERLAAQAAERMKRGREGVRNTEDARERLFAYPERPANVERADLTGQLDALLAERLPGYETFSAYFTKVFKFDPETMELRSLRRGSRVTAGTVLGRIGENEDGKAPHVSFAIRPVGDGAPTIDPKPILDGWKLLESTAIYRAAGENAFVDDERGPSVGQILLLSKSGLERRVLADPRIEMYACGREDVRGGRMDRRALAVMAYLAERGYRIGVTSMRCGRDGSITVSGNVSNHSHGGAVDIATINGLPVIGNQGPGSITEALVKDIMKLQGELRPDELISLHDFGGPSFAMSDHADHVHIGYRPRFRGQSDRARQSRVLKPEQWERLIGRLYELDQPTVPQGPSSFSIPAEDAPSASSGG